MQKLFSTDFFKHNRSRLRETLGAGIPIVITANGLLQRNSDNTYPFSQDSNFWYLTGIDKPDLVLVIDEDTDYILVPGRSASREAFDGAINDDELRRISGVSEVVSDEEGWQRLGSRLKQVDKVQTLAAPPPYIEQYGMYVNPARARLVERLKNLQPDIEVLDIREHLVTMRMLKQPEELAALQQAIDITIDGLRVVTVPDKLATYQFEYEIENDLTTAFRTHISSGHAFAPIVAGGSNGVTIHSVQNNGPLNHGELIILDVGAEVSHYAADITRTVIVGTPTERQKQVYDAVMAVQDFSLGLLKPGTILKEYEAAVEQFMGEKLKELGLIDELTHEKIRQYYPHAASHFLGLDVHDVGDYSRPLEPGMVLTCEPGVYIPEECIGVRIEDDILITETGHTVLSEKLPRVL
jgi:Xaa-Pro aminopeptidase